MVGEFPKYDYSTQLQIIEHLKGFMLDKRAEQLESVISERTRYITVVLEDIFQPHNASAVLRSCECFGIQDVHVIENRNEFSISPKVVMGATKWLTLYKYNKTENNTENAIAYLKDNGYRIIATSPHVKQFTPNSIDLNKGKIALFFGTELKGLSKTVMDNADEHLLIPTVGFSESLNLSVSAAICLQTLTNRLRNTDIDFKLSKIDSANLLHHWLRLSVKSWRSIEKRFTSKK